MRANVLVGLNGTVGSWYAHQYALAYARRLGAGLIGVFVETLFWEPPPMGRQAFERTIAELAAKLATTEQVSFQLQVRSGYPAATIVRLAGLLHSDLIVLGHTSDDAVRRWYTGSLSRLVLQEAPCRVVVVGDDDQLRSRHPLQTARGGSTSSQLLASRIGWLFRERPPAHG